MDHTGLEYLVHLLGEQVNDIVHFIYQFCIPAVSGAPLWQQLFTKQVDQSLDIRVLSKLNVLLGVFHAHFNAVENWPKH